METREVDGVRVTRASDNIFADLGFPDADELLLKTDLIIQLMKVMDARGLSREAAAPLLGVTPKVLYDLFSGELDLCGTEQLLRMLNALDQNVSIVVSPKRADERRAQIIVMSAPAAD